MDEQEFAVSRSHLDAQAVNEHARTASQSIILVNGGAATAALAFAASYETIDWIQGVLLASGLAFYVAGVIVGATNLGKLTNATYYFMRAWEERARENHAESAKHFNEAKAGQKGGDNLFRAGLAAFIVGTALLGAAIIFNPPEESAPARLHSQASQAETPAGTLPEN